MEFLELCNQKENDNEQITADVFSGVWSVLA